MRGIPGAQQEPALENWPLWRGNRLAAHPRGQCLPPAPRPSGAPSAVWGVSGFLKCQMTLFCSSGEWEKALVPLLALRDFGRRQGTAFHTPPHDADDPSPPRTVSHDLFLCSYVTREANLGSTGSTTMQTVFPHVRAGDDAHLAIFPTPHAAQANTHHVMVKSEGSGIREHQGSSQPLPLPRARHQAPPCAACGHL